MIDKKALFLFLILISCNNVQEGSIYENLLTGERIKIDSVNTGHLLNTYYQEKHNYLYELSIQNMTRDLESDLQLEKSYFGNDTLYAKDYINDLRGIRLERILEDALKISMPVIYNSDSLEQSFSYIKEINLFPVVIIEPLSNLKDYKKLN